MEIKYFDTVKSTNDIAKDLAIGGAAEGTTIVANHQSAGRGRMGRSFMSPEGTGLYMSVILRPKISAQNALLITTAAAVAVAKVAEKYTGERAQIKWVNDVYMREKKVCGILTEGKIADGALEYAVLGIGVNLMPPKGGFGDLSAIAGAVSSGEEINRDDFCRDVLDAFFGYYKNLESKPHYSEYKKRDMLRGCDVAVMRCGEVLYNAKAIAIDSDFSLLIERDGKKENLFSGEVSVKKQK